MKFCEDESMVTTIPKCASNCVYFLLKDNEVVYVGQTAQGIVRLFSHRDKDFDEIKIIYEAYSLFDKYLESDQVVLIHNDLHFDNIFYVKLFRKY